MVDPSEEGDFLHAIERYTEAITLNKNNHILFSNRSAAYSRVGKFHEALDDAKRCHELKPDWPKVRGVWSLIFCVLAGGGVVFLVARLIDARVGFESIPT